MKNYNETIDGFTLKITWNANRAVLRIESGPVEEPQEMIAQFEGLSEWGAQAATVLWVRDMIDGGRDLAPILQALGLPE